jgi:hypothetical protein
MYVERGGMPSVTSKVDVRGEKKRSQYDKRNAASIATASEMTARSGMRKSLRRWFDICVLMWLVLDWINISKIGEGSKKRFMSRFEK